LTGSTASFLKMRGAFTVNLHSKVLITLSGVMDYGTGFKVGGDVLLLEWINE